MKNSRIEWFMLKAAAFLFKMKEYKSMNRQEMQQELLKHFGYTGFCFEGRESSIGWDLRLISCPADLGFKQN